jgi:hypothetical protein
VSAVDGEPESRLSTIVNQQNINVRISVADEKFDSVSDSKIKEVADRLDTRLGAKSEGAKTRLKNMFKRLAAASTVSTDLVEGRAFGEDGRVKRLSENVSEIKYNSDAAGAFGASPSPECLETPKGREIIATKLSQAEIRTRRTPSGTMIKTAALKAAGIAAEVVGSVGDVMDVLQIVQVFGNAAYYDPGCEANPGDPTKCKFPTEFMTPSQAKDISQLAVKKQIDTLAMYVPKDPEFKPQFPLIRGPLDVLSADPYQNQTLIQLQVDAVQNRLLSADPWRGKFLTYFGSQTVINEIVNDPRDGLSYYTSKAGMTNQEIDSIYERAFSNVCLQNGGKVWKDAYTSGRPRFQCGFTKAGCDTARRQYFSPSSRGNYVEWYTYTDIETLLTPSTGRLAPVLNFTTKPSDEDGFCMVSSPGTAALCNYYKGEYDGVTHKCVFSAAYCQSIGTCHQSTSNVCYLPGPQMEALNFFFAGGGVREWIKVNGCSFVGSDADKASYTIQSVVYTFVPVTMLFTAGGRKMFQDAIANSKNWGPGIKAQMSDPMVGVGFTSAVVGLTTVVAVAAASSGLLTGAAAAAATGIGAPVAVLLIIAAGITIGVTMSEAEKAENNTAKVDKEDFAFQGLQKSVVTDANALANPGSVAGTYYVPTSRGYSAGWVTRKLPVTKKADGTLCTAVENYRNPTTCYPVASTADIPYVFAAPFVGINVNIIRTTYADSKERRQETGGRDYGHKIQCWKYDWTYKETGTRPTETTDAVFGPIPAGKVYGEPYGTIDSTMGNKVFDGYIRAGTLGSDGKTWCMRRRPEAVMFDSKIGTPAAETEYNMNRSWTSKMGDTGLYYPEYPAEAALLSAAIHNHFRYQLVYDKDSIPVNTMWDNLLMDAIFTEATVTEIRRYYCEQELVRLSSNTATINPRCYGYLSLGIPGYTWFAMSLPGKVSSSFNTITGTVTMGKPTQDNRDEACAVEYGANWEEDSAGLCYLNCNYGTGATNDTYASVSREWKSDTSKICYKQYPKWEDNARLHGEMTITKKIFDATLQGAPNDCPADKEKGGSGSLCYKKCSSLDPNLDTTKYEYLNDGATQCYKHDKLWENEASRKGRAAGTPARTYSTMNKPLAFGAVWKGLKSGGVCPSGYQNVGGICYTICNSNQTGVGPTCFNKYCPSGTTEKTVGLCTDNCPSEYQDVGGICYTICNSDQTGVGPTCFNKYCPSGKTEKTAGFCTDNVPAGYEDVSGIYYTNCNSDQTGVGPTCFNKYCPSGTTEKTAGLCTTNCNSGYSWDESACYRNCNTNYFRSSLGFCQESCHNISYSGMSAPTRTVTAGLCSAYNFSCPSSYDTYGVGTSTPTCYRPVASRARTLSCPAGYYRSAAYTCEKNTYNIGTPGTLPNIQGKCSGGVREKIDGLCYNPCQPAFNGGITCPAGATNTNGFCVRPIQQYSYAPPPPPSWWYDGIQCPQACSGGYSYQATVQENGRWEEHCYEAYYEAWDTNIDGMGYIWGTVCSSEYVYDTRTVNVDVPYTCTDVQQPSAEVYNYGTFAEWCASVPAAEGPAAESGGDAYTGGYGNDSSWYTQQ